MKRTTAHSHALHTLRNLCRIVLATSLVVFSLVAPVAATPPSGLSNPGFESGLTGWTGTPSWDGVDSVWTDGTKQYSFVIADGTVDWTVAPNEDFFVVLQPPDEGHLAEVGDDAFYFNAAYSALQLSLNSYEYLMDAFDENFYDFAYLYQDVTMTAGQSVTVKWNYLNTDSANYNDGSFCSFVNTDVENISYPDTADIPTVNGYQAQVGILGAANAGTYTTGGHSGTGWQTATFTASTAGIYRLGFAVFNAGDNEVSPYLFLDDGSPTMQKDGIDFEPIAKDPAAPTPPMVDESFFTLGGLVDETYNPIRFIVGSQGTVEAYAYDPGNMEADDEGYVRQNFDYNDWGSTFYFKDGDDEAFYATSYFGGGDMNPFGEGTQQLVGNAVQTVWLINDGDIRITQKITYTSGQEQVEKKWVIENLSDRTFTDMRFLHGGDAFFAGIDNAKSYYNASQKMIYIINEDMTLSGVMSFAGAQSSPASHYFAGGGESGSVVLAEMMTGHSEETVLPPRLDDTANPDFVDAYYALEWDHPSLAPSATWTVTSYERWSAAGLIQVVSPASQTATDGQTATFEFTLQNFGAETDTFTLEAISLLDWVAAIQGDVSVDIEGNGGTATVSVAITVPAGASVDDMDIVTLRAVSENDGTLTGEGAVNLTVVAVDEDPTPTETPSPTEALTPTPTETPSPTEAVTPTPTETPSPTEALTPTPTETPSPTEALTPTPTEAPSPTEALTPTPTETPSPTPTQAIIIVYPDVGEGSVEGLDGTTFEPGTELIIEKVMTSLNDSDKASINAGIRLLVDGKEITDLYDIRLMLDGEPVQPDGSVKVKIKLTAEQMAQGGLQIIYIDDFGEVTLVPSTIVDGYIVFTTDHFSSYGIIGYTNPLTGDSGAALPILALFVALGGLILTRRRGADKPV